MAILKRSSVNSMTKAELIREVKRLRRLASDYLANDGSQGRYDVLELGEARRRLLEALDA